MTVATEVRVASGLYMDIFFSFYEFIKPPLLPSPNVVIVSLGAIDQLMPVQIRQAIRVSGVVPVVVAVLCPIDSQPSERSIDDLLIKKSDERWHAGYLTTGGVSIERGLHFGVCGAQFRIGRPQAPVDRAVKRLGIFNLWSSGS
jgi:hypothetical protein